jgi:hypothetical protein
MKRKMFAGSTAQSIPIFVADTTSTTGAGLSGLTSATSGLVCEYRRQGDATWTAVTLSGGTLGTWSSGGIVADGALAGAYELGIPNAAIASSAGVSWCVVRLRGATNMLAVLVEIELDAVNYQSNTAFVASVPAVVGAVGSVAGNVGGNVLGSVAGSVASVTGSVNNLTNLPSIPAGWLTAAGIAAAALNGKGDWNTTTPPTSAAIATAVWTDTTAGDFTTASSPGKILVAQLGGAFSTTSSSIYSTASLANAPTGGSAPTVTQIRTEIDANSTQFAAIKAKTDNLPASPAAVGSAMTLTLSQSGLTVRALDAIADSSLTVGDALVAALCGAAGKESVSGTSYTVKTPSTGTTIRTFTLDSSSAPTSRI